MNRSDEQNPDRLDQELDDATVRISAQSLDEGTASEASARVKARLATAAAHALTCAEIQALIPDALAGRLAAPRALLVEEHTRGCVECRRAWKAERSGTASSRRHSAAPATTAAHRIPWLGVAAALILTLLAGWVVSSKLPQGGGTVTVAALDGLLFQVGRSEAQPLVLNAAVGLGQELRTGKDGGAVVVLPDGSRVELRERTQLTVERGRDGLDIQLDRGAVIVEASKQGSGHLYVTTPECRVAVKGTVFSVDAGTKGARVAVLEGEVHVDPRGPAPAGTATAVLLPGDQYASSRDLRPRPLAAEVAWSRDAQRWQALAAELKQVRTELAAIAGPAPRTSSDLLARLPADSVVVAALPNLGRQIEQARSIFNQHLAQPGALAEWWKEHDGEAGLDRIDAAVAQVTRYAAQLGDELLVAAPRGHVAGSPIGGLLLVAAAKDEAALKAMIAADAAGTPLRLVDGPEALPVAAPAKLDALYVVVRDGLVVVATHRAPLAAVLAGDGGLGATRFGGELAAAYADGTTWLAGVDLQGLLGPAVAGGDDKARQALAMSGLDGARSLVLESEGEGETATMRAALGFDGPRHGMMSWLAEPAPMGSLDFISPDANVVAAAVVKDPKAMLDELGTLAGGAAPQLRAQLDAVSQFLGVDVGADLVAPLGGEIAVALDGPVLPTPAFKLVLEVYDAGRLQHGLEAVVAKAAELAAREGRPVPSLRREEAGGRSWYALATAPATFELHYTFVDGYLVAAPQRALVERALTNRAAGVTLAGSAAFARRLPPGIESNVSALFYRNARALAAAVSAPEPALALADGLEVAYAGPDRITAASIGRSLPGMLLDAALAPPPAPR